MAQNTKTSTPPLTPAQMQAQQLARQMAPFRREAKAKLQQDTNEVFYLDYPTEMDLGLRVLLLPYTLKDKDTLSALAEHPLSAVIVTATNMIDAKLKQLEQELLNSMGTAQSSREGSATPTTNLCSMLEVDADHDVAERMRLIDINSRLSQQNKIKTLLFFFQSLKSYFDLFPLLFFLRRIKFDTFALRLNHSLFDGIDPRKKERLRLFATLMSDFDAGCERMEQIATFAQNLCKLRDDGTCYGLALYGLDNCLDALNALKKLNPAKDDMSILQELSATLSNRKQAALITFNEFCNSAAFLRLQVNAALNLTAARANMRAPRRTLSADVMTANPMRRRRSNKDAKTLSLTVAAAADTKKQDDANKATAQASAPAQDKNKNQGLELTPSQSDAFADTTGAFNPFAGNQSFNSFNSFSSNPFASNVDNSTSWDSNNFDPWNSTQNTNSAFVLGGNSNLNEADLATMQLNSMVLNTQPVTPAPEPESRPEPQPESKSEPEAEAGDAAGDAAGDEPKLETEPAAEAKAETEVEAKAKAEVEAAAEAATAATTTKLKAQAKTKTKTKTRTKSAKQDTASAKSEVLETMAASENAAAATAAADTAASTLDTAVAPASASAPDSTADTVEVETETKTESKTEVETEAEAEPKVSTSKAKAKATTTTYRTKAKSKRKDTAKASPVPDGNTAEANELDLTDYDAEHHQKLKAAAAMAIFGNASEAEDNADGAAVSTSNNNSDNSDNSARTTESVKVVSSNAAAKLRQLQQEEAARAEREAAVKAEAQAQALAQAQAQESQAKAATADDDVAPWEEADNTITAKDAVDDSDALPRKAHVRLDAAMLAQIKKERAQREQKAQEEELFKQEVEDAYQAEKAKKAAKAKFGPQSEAEEIADMKKRERVHNYERPRNQARFVKASEALAATASKETAATTATTEATEPSSASSAATAATAATDTAPNFSSPALRPELLNSTVVPLMADPALASGSSWMQQNKKTLAEQVGLLQTLDSSPELMRLKYCVLFAHCYLLTEPEYIRLINTKSLKGEPEVILDSDTQDGKPKLPGRDGNGLVVLTEDNVSPNSRYDEKIKTSLLYQMLRPIEELSTTQQVLTEMVASFDEQIRTLKMQASKFKYYAQVLGRDFTVVGNAYRHPDIDRELVPTNLSAYASSNEVQMVLATILLSAYNLYFKVNRNGLVDAYQRLNLTPPI